MTTLAEVKKEDDLARIEALEGAMLECPQVSVPLDHFFAHGVYIRQGVIPPNVFIVGHEHRFEHVCVLLKGSITLATPDGVETLCAPLTWVAKPGRKVFFTHEETVMQNVHATNERDLDRIEDELVIKSDTWRENEARAANEALAAKVREHLLSGRG